MPALIARQLDSHPERDEIPERIPRPAPASLAAAAVRVWRSSEQLEQSTELVVVELQLEDARDLARIVRHFCRSIGGGPEHARVTALCSSPASDVGSHVEPSSDRKYLLLYQ